MVTQRGRIAVGLELNSMLNYRETAMSDTKKTPYEAPAVIATEVLKGMLDDCSSGFICGQ